MHIMKLKRQHIADVASLHERYIDGGFISSLGSAFLVHLYESMITSENAFCLVAEDAGEIHGFISGTYDLSIFYNDFLKKKFVPVMALLVPKLIKPKIFWKLVETFIYPSKQKNLPGAELLSIVVSDKYRGKGVSESLFKSMVSEFKEKNITNFKVVVGSNLSAATRFYQKMGGIPYAEIEVHNAEVSRVYVWEIS